MTKKKFDDHETSSNVEWRISEENENVLLIFNSLESRSQCYKTFYGRYHKFLYYAKVFVI